MVLRTINLILTVAIIAAIEFAAFWIYGQIQEFGSLANWAEDLGSGAAGGLTGFATGAVSGLFNFGKDLGNRFNPFD